MTTYLINYLRIPNGVPKPDALAYLEHVEATFLPYGGKWLVLDGQGGRRAEREPSPGTTRPLRRSDRSGQLSRDYSRS